LSPRLFAGDAGGLEIRLVQLSVLQEKNAKDCENNKKVFQFMKTRDKLSPSALKLQNPARWICSLATVALLSLGLAYRGQAQTPIVVQTIAALRSLSTSSFTNDTVAYVIDYYGSSSFGYRGGGHFRWRTPYSSISLCCGNVAVDDGGRFIACSSNTNGLWERVFDGETPNVKMWGAYGDNSHNDTAAIQNAINGAASYGDGTSLGAGELLFPAGIYLITNTLVFNANLTHIRGEGPLNTTIKMQLGVSADIFRTYNANRWLTTGEKM